MSGNAGLNGNQNHAQGGKISTRVLAPPGGGSTFSFSDMGGGGAKMSYATSSNGRVVNNNNNSRPPVNNGRAHDIPPARAPAVRRNPSDYDHPLGGTGGREGYPQKVSPGKTKRRPSLDYDNDAVSSYDARSKQNKSIPGLESHYQNQEPVRSTRNNNYYDNGERDSPQAQAYSSRGSASSQAKMSAREYADALKAQIDNKASLRGNHYDDVGSNSNSRNRNRRENYGSDDGYNGGRNANGGDMQMQQQSTRVSSRANPPGGRSSLQLC